MSKPWWEDTSLEELQARRRELESSLLKPSRGSGIRYKPGMYSKSIMGAGERTLGEEFLEKLEEEGDEEKVFEKYLRKGTARPGTTKSAMKKYLIRKLEEAREEGRI